MSMQSYQVYFSKMQGLGNDFMVIDGVNQPVQLNPSQIVKLSHRTKGIGFDQLLLVEPSLSKEADFVYRIFNADGNEVGQCGNGARCIAKFIQLKGLSEKTHLVLKTQTGVLQTECLAEGNVRVNMGPPQFAPEKIPFLTEKEAQSYLAILEDQQVHFSVLSVGNPHVVLWSKEWSTENVLRIGKAFQLSPLFPEQVNVSFASQLDKQTIKLRVYERGCGETQACGSGACAAVIAGRRLAYLEGPEVKVIQAGGELSIRWEGGSEPVWMEGPAEWVFDGTVSV